MEYVFGTAGDVEVLKTKGTEHSDLAGFQQVSQENSGQTIVDCFRVVRKTDSTEDTDGNCYDWYEIDRHYRFVDDTATAAVAKSAHEASGISFVIMAEAGTIDGVTAGEHTELFEEWAFPVAYKTGNIRRQKGKLYRCLQDHTSQEDWGPDVAVSLWVNISDPAEEWPEWSQPVGAQDAYMNGDKVSHNGAHWVSTADNNVWEPGVYGWQENQ